MKGFSLAMWEKRFKILLYGYSNSKNVFLQIEMSSSEPKRSNVSFSGQVKENLCDFWLIGSRPFEDMLYCTQLTLH